MVYKVQLWREAQMSDLWSPEICSIQQLFSISLSFSAKKRGEGWGGAKGGWKCHQGDCSVRILASTFPRDSERDRGLLIVLLRKNLKPSRLRLQMLRPPTEAVSAQLQDWNGSGSTGAKDIHYVYISVHRSALSGACVSSIRLSARLAVSMDTDDSCGGGEVAYKIVTFCHHLKGALSQSRWGNYRSDHEYSSGI